LLKKDENNEMATIAKTQTRYILLALTKLQKMVLE